MTTPKRTSGELQWTKGGFPDKPGLYWVWYFGDRQPQVVEISPKLNVYELGVSEPETRANYFTSANTHWAPIEYPARTFHDEYLDWTPTPTKDNSDVG